ncbi:MAG: glycosyltransferase family 2 protein [Lentisphaerae bacterium]|nr:glycosyltransferase family 2 protein [Lentisphaerota bacterium]MBT5607044.1 glycosyltransferase family 2 protein [Lentisphaerota bacterium]MBT7055798.1 glycosyltransferase family 2 protein [Lentisphaerota bacterium]
MKLSVVIPAHNEEGCIRATIEALVMILEDEKIAHDIVVVNDNSSDSTEAILQELSTRFAGVRYVNNSPPNGFGFAVRKGLECFEGDAVAVYMADASDSPADLVTFYRTLLEKDVDCVFGTRWSKGGRVFDYPRHKRILNRAANHFIRVLMQIRCDDITNAFKLYRREVIEGCHPFLSHHFNLTVEVPLKAVIRGYSYAVVPNSWTNRTAGVSKLKINEMGSRYLFIVLYCLLEKWLARGDYHRLSAPPKG